MFHVHHCILYGVRVQSLQARAQCLLHCRGCMQCCSSNWHSECSTAAAVPAVNNTACVNAWGIQMQYITLPVFCLLLHSLFYASCMQGGLAGVRQTAALVNAAALADEPASTGTQVGWPCCIAGTASPDSFSKHCAHTNEPVNSLTSAVLSSSKAVQKAARNTTHTCRAIVGVTHCTCLSTCHNKSLAEVCAALIQQPVHIPWHTTAPAAVAATTGIPGPSVRCASSRHSRPAARPRRGCQQAWW
jgi:hypothetical protein